jgi:hypothetical protein
VARRKVKKNARSLFSRGYQGDPSGKEVLRVDCQLLWFVLFFGFFLNPALLAENNRLNNTVDVVAAFDSLISSHRGEVQCVVTSAEVCLHFI